MKCKPLAYQSPEYGAMLDLRFLSRVAPPFGLEFDEGAVGTGMTEALAF
ncbi:MAG: hypothetical protein IPL35_14980 [Sphingobacteriales bacterium]|nr:hypothetical protein [Sphingobacteriales bacterium]